MAVTPLSAGFPIVAQAHRQKFLEGWGTGRENLFPKRFPSPQRFPPNFRLLQIFRHPPAALPRNVPLGKRPGDDHSSQPGIGQCPSCRGAAGIRGRDRHGWQANTSFLPNKKSPADTEDDQQQSQRGGSFMSCRGANRLTPYGRLPAGRGAAGEGRPLPFCTTGHHWRPAAGARGCWPEPEGNARSRPGKGTGS